MGKRDARAPTGRTGAALAGLLTALLAAEASALELQKSADRPSAEVGDLVGYRIVVENRGEADFTAAEGRPVFLLDAPPSGFVFACGSEVARIRRGDQVLETRSGFVDCERLRARKRLVRFGPFDLPAGATLELSYRTTVGLDTRPGRYANRVVATDAGGVELSREAVAHVHVAHAPDFETGVVLGRVHCDGDREAGVFGARVYLDTGSYAVTDSAGLFHFSRVEPGTRLVKIDAATLAGGRVIGPPTRLLRMSEGLPARADFPVACAREAVTIAHPRASLTRGGAAGGAGPGPASPPSGLTVSGAIDPLRVAVDGVEIELPTAAAVLRIPASLRAAGDGAGGPRLVEVPAGGYGAERPGFELRFAAPRGARARRFSFGVARVLPSGELTPFYSASGAGGPPATLAWDGRGDDGRPAEAGALYAARLTVVFDRDGAEASSAWAVFGFARGDGQPELKRTVWRGNLFGGGPKNPTSTSELHARVTELAAALSDRDRVLIETHWDGTGEPVQVIARTQLEAELIQALLVAAGVSADRIEARGRGSLEPIADAQTAAGRRQNRRVVVTVTRAAAPDATPEVPASLDVGAEIVVDEIPIEIDARGRFRAAIDLPARGAVALAARAPDGRRAAIDLRAQADGPPGADPPRDPAPAPAEVRAARLEVLLPPEGTRLGATELGVTGRTDPENQVTVNGAPVRVGSDGRFAAVVPLRPGAGRLLIRARDSAGHVATIDWPVTVSERELFVLGLGEAILSSAYTARGWFGESASLPGMNPDTTVALGQSLLHGRAVLYLKSRFSAGDRLDDVRVTAHIDTGRRRQTGSFFEQVIDPARDYPVYGDSADEVRDVSSLGKSYLRIEAGKSSAHVGSLQTRLEGGALFRYDRTIDGARLDVDHEAGAHHAKITAFGTRERAESVRDVNLFRATGGSLYYLRHSYVLEGSESVRVVVRDRDNGLVLVERLLARGEHYSIDYPGGRILLDEPLAQTSASTWVIDGLESSTGPLEGHPVFLEVRYEHRDLADSGQRAGGVYVRDEVAGRVSVGAGALVEERGPGEDYALWGADARIRIGAESSFTAEVAGSHRQDAATFLSQDGGLSFRDLHSLARTTGDGHDGHQLGWRLGADLKLGEVMSLPVLAATSVHLYAQDLDRGFSSGGTILEQGRRKLGGQIASRLSEHDRLLLRHDAEVALLPRIGPTPADVIAGEPRALDERASYLTTLQWAHDRGRWHHKLEGAHQRLTSTAALAPAPGMTEPEAAVDARRLGLGARTAYDATERLTLRAGQQVLFRLRDADPRLRPLDPMTGARGSERLAGVSTGVGSDLALAPGLSLTADFAQRWNGDRAAALGLRTTLSETASTYVSERLATHRGRASAALVVGAEERFGDDLGGRSYGEYQIEHGVSGHRNRALLGLGRRWQPAPGVLLGAGFEHQQIFGGFLPDGTAVGHFSRNVVHGAADFVRSDRLKAMARVELRLDNARPEPESERLLVSDPRPDAEPGAFADHGGTLPGAPLVVPAGERVQLVAGLGGDFKATPAATMFARLRLATTSLEDEQVTGQAAAVTEARYVETTFGWAYRPRTHDWLHLLARYSLLLEARPLALESGSSEQTSHVLAAAPLVELPWRLVASGKVALKLTEVDDRPLSGGPAIASATRAVLALGRLGYRIVGSFDLTGELRGLFLDKPEGAERRYGTLFEVGYTVKEHARLAVGYNLSRFSDDELGDLTRDSHGVFVRLTGQY